jgi:uncharacterized protein (DUF1800 family)
MQEHDYITGFRFGFGAAQGFDPVAELSGFDAATDGATELRQRFARFAELKRKSIESGNSANKMAEERIYSANLQQRDVHNAIVRAVSSPRMFTERLALFWSNHFCLGVGNALVARFVGPYVKVLRQHMFGRFRDLLAAAILNPAMMNYLNLQQAIGPNSVAGKKTGKGLNENLGREILELHSLGVAGGYTQQDVGALSRLLTGWRYKPDTGDVDFMPRRAEPGRKILLGQAIGGAKPNAADLNKAFDVLAGHEATARFIARKLVLHFLGPGLDDVSVRIAEVFMQTDGDLSRVYAALLDSTPPNSMAQFRNDTTFLISALRALPLREKILDFELRNNGRPKTNPATVGAINQLRQKFWLAPSPAGWPDTPDYWMSPSVMTARLRLIPRLVRLADVREPQSWANDVLGPLQRPATRRAINAAPNRLQGMGLVLASPEFNRR